MSVRAWLEGHQFDLDELVALLPSGDTRVVKDGDAYYLVSTQIDNRRDGVPFYEVAPKVLELVNGLARVNNPSYRPVRLSGRYQEGDRRHTVVTLGAAEVRCGALVAAAVTGGPDRPMAPPPGPGRLRLASVHSDVAEALALMSQAEPLGWVELWKVYEIIRDNIKPATVDSLGWVTSGEHTAFTASANRPDVGGPGARHARIGGDPPKRWMDMVTGRQFVSSLVSTWLVSLK